MMFWIVAAALVALVVFPLLQALLREGRGLDSQSSNVAFFQAQEAEIGRQQAAGLMSPEEARAAIAEAARRLLSLSRQDGARETAEKKRAIWPVVLVVIAVPVLALPLYIGLGSPNLPAMPYATRTDLNRNAVELARLVGRLDAHLVESPDDARGWELAFPVYMRLGRFDSAVEAASKVIALKGDSGERQASLAEALISAAQGQIDAAAKTAIARSLELSPKLPRARFYSAMSLEQAGDMAGALAMFRQLSDELEDGPEKSAVAVQLERLSALDGAASKNPLQSLAPNEQAKAIRGMVDGLEERLQKGGGTADEWLRLVRALTVLGEKDRAQAAISGASAALKDDAAAMAALDRLAQELRGAR